MKKFIILFIVFSLSFIFSPQNLSFANQNKTYYAKVEKDNVYFYSNPIDENSSKIFIIPKSYFVYLTNSANDQFFCAQYKDIFGYVKKEDVTVMSGTPQTPYASANFTIYDIDGLALYPTPKFTNNTSLVRIDYLTIVSTFYGEIEGENVPDMSNPWYYCKINENGIDLFGYVYSAFCYKESVIQTNNETFDIVNEPIFNVTNVETENLSEVAMAFIIIGVSLPCILITYLLIKPNLQKSKSQIKKKAKKRHGDYFEFDENDLN